MCRKTCNYMEYTHEKKYVTLHESYMYMTGKLLKYDWKFSSPENFQSYLSNFPVIHVTSM